MATISIEEFCAALYCAYTTPDALDVGPDARIAFLADVIDGDLRTTYRVECEGVRDLVVTTERDSHRETQPEDRLELSVVELEGRPGGWRVWFNPWYLDEIEFHCARLLINEAEVVGEGRWLQDDLPSRQPRLPD